MTPSTSPGEVAIRLNKLAALYKSQGKYEQAEQLYRRALGIDEQQLGPEHPNTATSLNNLAELYRTQGKYEQAEPLVQRALYIREQQLGLEHPDAASSLNSLAMLYKTQGKYEQAEQLYRRALGIDEQQLGPEHPNTATSLNNLAELYRTQGKYEQAEPLYQRVLAIYEKVLGLEHPDTVTSLSDLALLYQAQRKYEQAEPLLQLALAAAPRGENGMLPKQTDSGGQGSVEQAKADEKQVVSETVQERRKSMSTNTHSQSSHKEHSNQQGKPSLPEIDNYTPEQLKKFIQKAWKQLNAEEKDEIARKVGLSAQSASPKTISIWKDVMAGGVTIFTVLGFAALIALLAILLSKSTMDAMQWERYTYLLTGVETITFTAVNADV